MTKRVFRSIFLASLAVLLATLALILGALYTYFSDVQAEQLRLQTALVAHALETEGVSYFDDLDTSDRRITWIAADGTVTGSDGAPLWPLPAQPNEGKPGADKGALPATGDPGTTLALLAGVAGAATLAAARMRSRQR